MSNLREKNIEAVDLFCGAGGLAYGLQKAGLNLKAGYDMDPHCKYPFEYNNKAKFYCCDVKGLKPADLAKCFNNDSVKLLAGCAPCQTFSTYNQNAPSSDSRWWLLGVFTRLVTAIRPELVTMENVPKLCNHTVYNYFRESLKKNGYYISENIVEAHQYGVPQYRRRLVVLASLLGPVELLRPEVFRPRKVNVKDAISSLPKVQAGFVQGSDPIHQSPALSDINLRRIKASVPGGTWRDWDVDLRANCHRKPSGKTYPSVYGRMSWDEPAPTITTQFFGFGNGRFGHPEQDRAITLREGAILQSFPRSYRFVAPGEPVYKKVIGRLIGNAVPVRLAEVIGKSFTNHVKDYC